MAEHEAEPWLRGTHTEIDAVRRAVLHALELAEEDVSRWTRDMDAAEMETEPMGLPSVAFQLRHIARSVNRLMTYARGGRLTGEQLRALQEEGTPGESSEELLAEFRNAIRSVRPFMMGFAEEELGQNRSVGRMDLPTTLAGLLIHIAEHTQRHVGQLITTAQVVRAMCDAEQS